MAKSAPISPTFKEVPWYADHYPKMARFSYDEVTNDTARRRDWAKAMLTDGVALLTGLPDTDEALTDTAGLIGYVRPSYFGLTFEVKTHIKPTNLAFTAKALPLHTDLPDEDLAPGVQFLHCRANSVEGGNSIFVDGLAVAEDFRKAYPEDFELLITVDVPYFCEHDTFDMRSRQRVIELDEHGNISGVTISQHHADIFDMPQHELDRYYPAFCRFGRMMRDDKYLMRFRLNAGECIVFDNHRIVHGRLPIRQPAAIGTCVAAIPTGASCAPPTGSCPGKDVSNECRYGCRFGADPDRQSEQALREDLAAAFRLAVKFGWSESVGNHFSAAVSEDGSKFLMNPKWRHFGEIRPATCCCSMPMMKR